MKTQPSPVLHYPFLRIKTQPAASYPFIKKAQQNDKTPIQIFLSAFENFSLLYPLLLNPACPLPAKTESSSQRFSILLLLHKVDKHEDIYT